MAQKTPRGAALIFYRESLSTETDKCILWPFAKSALGYAVFGKQRGAVNSSIVSRVACAEKHGMPPTPEHEAAHICGNGSLGCINHRHLAWKTSKENKADTLDHGTRNFGERNGRSKLDQKSVSLIRSLAATTSQRVVAKKFGIDQSTVSDIMRGKRWGWMK